MTMACVGPTIYIIQKECTSHSHIGVEKIIVLEHIIKESLSSLLVTQIIPISVPRKQNLEERRRRNLRERRQILFHQQHTKNIESTWLGSRYYNFLSLSLSRS